MKVLLIAPLPPPLSGQSVAVQALFDQLTVDGHDVMPINMSKDSFRQGITSMSRALEVMKIVWRTWKVMGCFIVTTMQGNLIIHCIAARLLASQMKNGVISNWERYGF